MTINNRPQSPSVFELTSLTLEECDALQKKIREHRKQLKRKPRKTPEEKQAEKLAKANARKERARLTRQNKKFLSILSAITATIEAGDFAFNQEICDTINKLYQAYPEFETE